MGGFLFALFEYLDWWNHRRLHGEIGMITSVENGDAAREADLVRREFSATRPDQLWVCDLTYIRTWVGFAYLALVIDVFSRRIVGWSFATHLRTDLPLEALEMAIWARGNEVAGLVHHTDRGSQYLAIRYADTLTAAGALASVGSVGDSFDNAMAESTIGQIKAELVARLGPWRTVDQLDSSAGTRRGGSCARWWSA